MYDDLVKAQYGEQSAETVIRNLTVLGSEESTVRHHGVSAGTPLGALEFSEDSSTEGAATAGSTSARKLDGYFVTITDKTKVRRLHWLGRCCVQPGVNCREWELLGTEPPKPEAYDFVCRRCWPQGGPPREGRQRGAHRGGVQQHMQFLFVLVRGQGGRESNHHFE